jgi:hypothetical protein
MSRLNVSSFLSLFLLFAGCNSNQQPKTNGVDPAKLQPGPVQHETLSSELTARITKLHDTFNEVDPSPLSKWMDDFMRDQHPEREVEIYEGMARAYTTFCTGRNLTLDAKREVYGVVMQRSATSDAEVLKNLGIKVITIEDAKAILKLYDMPPAPITVSPSP